MRRPRPSSHLPPPLTPPPYCSPLLPPSTDLTKKYLKKQKLRDYIRTVSSKDGYLLKYFSVAGDADEEDEEEDE